MSQFYDVIIIGGGPAGLSAGIYATRSMLTVRLFEKEVVGGQASMTDHIENYPGFADPISGFELTDRMREQAERLGVEIDFSAVDGVDFSKPIKKITAASGDFKAKSVIIASGVRPSRLDVPGASEFTGRGISYCATCDGPFFRNKRVIVIGGGNSAVEEAIYLSKFADSVTIVHRRDELRADKIVQKRAFDNGKIALRFDSIITAVKGETAVSAVTIKNVITGIEEDVATDGIFVYVGNLPNTGPFYDKLNVDEKGYIMTDEVLATSEPGVFAAGDVRNNPLKQIVWAAAEGALAAVSAEKYIERMH